jgi:hypothetical protein
METTIVICPQCRRVIAVGAGLPALCFAAVPETERRGPTAALVDDHPAVHRACVELPVLAPDGLDGDELLHELERLYAEQIGAFAHLAGAPKTPG